MLRNERGEGRLGVVVWLLIMAAGIFVAVRTIPTRVAVLELHDFADEQIQLAGTMGGRVKPAELLGSILDKADELQLPLDEKDLKLDIRSGDIRLTMRHKVVVDLEVYEWQWDFDEEFKHLRM